jgi:hypothetical protein
MLQLYEENVNSIAMTMAQWRGRSGPNTVLRCDAVPWHRMAFSCHPPRRAAPAYV